MYHLLIFLGIQRAGGVNHHAAGGQGVEGAVDQFPLGLRDAGYAFWRPVAHGIRIFTHHAFP
ncbi:hypothetical protein D3C71_1994150 [compost metagenome]